MIKLATAFGALLTALVFYAQTQVCDYNKTLTLQEQALKNLQDEIGGPGKMTVKYNKQLNCVEIEEKRSDENNIYNQIQKLTKITIAVINKDNLETISDYKPVSIEGKSDEETLSILTNLYEQLIDQKNQILNSESNSKDKEIKNLMKAYEELLSDKIE